MKVKIEFEVELPDVEHTKEELTEFLRFETGDNWILEKTNAFKGENIDPIFGTLGWEYTEVRLADIKEDWE